MSESEPELPRPLLVLRAAAAKARARHAPVARETSDVQRFRGVWAAGAVFALTIVAVVALDLGTGALRAPAPLSRSHQNAGLECANCHADANPNRGCKTCHGAHASTRSAHRRLVNEAALGCVTCHAAHGTESLVFLPSGEALHHSGSQERALGAVEGFRPAQSTTLPLVRADRCDGCHEPSAAGDPLQRCLMPGSADLGAKQPIVCFDEHRSVGSAGPGGARVEGRPPERDAAAEAARELLAVRGVAVAQSSVVRPLGWIGAATLAGLGAFFVARTRRRRLPAATPFVPLRVAGTLRLPQIDTTTCLGCYACVDACPYDVLEVERYVARVVRPDDCCGLTLCEQRCPNGSLVVREGEAAETPSIVDERLEVLESPGLYLAGDLTGLPLIKNAIHQGALASRAIAVSLSDKRAAALGRAAQALDLVIVGAGPAGISAALEAKAKGLGFVVLEQGSVAESIRSFPRGKLVFDQPLGMPIAGDLWLDECTKEELLGKWLRIVRKERLPIREGSRVTAIKRVQGGPPLGVFEVRSLDAAGEERIDRARRILLAIGRRGSPRKLDIDVPEQMADRVHYALADARSFAGQRVIVVGLGDVAMEAALALARQPDTRVVVSYRGERFRRGKARNIDEMQRAIEAGRLEVIWRSEVERIEPFGVVLVAPAGKRSVECDALFVMIGAVAAASLLPSAPR